MSKGRPFVYQDMTITHLMIVYGNDIEKVGKHLGTTYETIAIHCRRLGIPGKGRDHLRKFTDVEFIEMFNRLEGSVLELAIHFDCVSTTIKKALNRLKITTRRQERR